MGVVYEAFDRKRSQRICVKTAKLGFRRALSPELEGALKVRHPNICVVNEIHTAQTPGGEVDFLTMEFLEGETLSTHLALHGKLSPEDALAVARQLCAAVTEAHRSGIIHRDLKSGNVMLCGASDGSLRAVITDFGLAGETSDFAEVSARRATWRRNCGGGSRHQEQATFTPSAWCFTKWRPAWVPARTPRRPVPMSRNWVRAGIGR